MKFILNVANNKAVSWTIGSKPSGNSNVVSFRAGRWIRKDLRQAKKIDGIQKQPSGNKKGDRVRSAYR